MNELASPTSVARDGYTVLPGFLSEKEVRSIQAAVDLLLDNAYGESCARPNNTLVPLRWDDPVVECAAGDPERVRRVSQPLGADDLRWISAYISVKDPQSLPLWWHQDWWCWDHPVSYRPAPVQIAVLCYLSDTDVRSGALRVLPGSHSRSTGLHAALPEAHRHDSTARDAQHVAMRDHPGQVSLELCAGDAVLTDYRLLHGTHVNAGEHRRDCVLLSFTPSWRDLPADVQGHLISHPALPDAGEDVPTTGWAARLLPTHVGPRRDLELSRDAPAVFSIHEA